MRSSFPKEGAFLPRSIKLRKSTDIPIISAKSFDAFVERIPDGTDLLEERIRDPQILIDEDIAVIWSPHEFLINGTVDHRGTDIVHLVRQMGVGLSRVSETIAAR